MTDTRENGNKTCEYSENFKCKLRRVLTPNPEDAMLPNLYGNRAAVTVLPDSFSHTPPSSSLNITKALSSRDFEVFAIQQNMSGSNMNVKSKSNVDLRKSGDFNCDSVGEDSSFILEHRNSKRLAKKTFGGRVLEGVFVESRLIRDESIASKSGLRKIALSRSLQSLQSPTGEDSQSADETSPSVSEVQVKRDSVSAFEERLNYANSNINTDFDRISEALSVQNKVITCVEIHNEQRATDPEIQSENSDYQPVPRVRSKPCTEKYSTPNSSHDELLRSPPCPKPRRKLKSSSESSSDICNYKKDSEDVELTRGPMLLLDPVALQHGAESRGAPNINPDGSVEIHQGWSLIRPWW